MEFEFKDCVVCLVDDFIVCGIIFREIVSMVCEVGVCKVIFVSCVLFIKYFYIYGIDFVFFQEFIVYEKMRQDIVCYINVDEVVY